MWHAPPIFQVKINTDGAARGSPGLAGFGGIFRDHLGRVLGCFAGSLGIAYALEAELQAVIHAIHLASQKGWHSLWIESDSTLVIHFLSSLKHDVPWRFSTIWFNCRAMIASMSVKVSHIYREGNQVADCLANFGATQVGIHWWDSCPPCALAAYCRDLTSFLNYRFRL
jgi:ribonuclease HI